MTVIALGVADAYSPSASRGPVARTWIDRSFFREAYDAEQVLTELSEQVREHRRAQIPAGNGGVAHIRDAARAAGRGAAGRSELVPPCLSRWDMATFLMCPSRGTPER